jgi:hypothetical protein
VLASFTGIENSCLQHAEQIVAMPDAVFEPATSCLYGYESLPRPILLAGF